MNIEIQLYKACMMTSHKEKLSCHLILHEACFCTPLASHPTAPGQAPFSYENVLLTYKKKILQKITIKNNTTTTTMVLTWLPCEVCRIKTEFFFTLRTIFGNGKEAVTCVSIPPPPPIVFSHKAAAAAFSAAWFRSDVANDALRDACLQFLSYLHPCFHSGDGPGEAHLKTDYQRPEMRKINFKAPKTAGAEGHRTLTVALWLWNRGGGLLFNNNNNNNKGRERQSSAPVPL